MSIKDKHKTKAFRMEIVIQTIHFLNSFYDAEIIYEVEFSNEFRKRISLVYNYAKSPIFHDIQTQAKILCLQSYIENNTLHIF